MGDFKNQSRSRLRLKPIFVLPCQASPRYSNSANQAV